MFSLSSISKKKHFPSSYPDKAKLAVLLIVKLIDKTGERRAGR